MAGQFGALPREGDNIPVPVKRPDPLADLSSTPAPAKSSLPPLPAGFTLDQPKANTLPPLPDGFTLDQPITVAKGNSKDRTFFQRYVSDPNIRGKNNILDQTANVAGLVSGASTPEEFAKGVFQDTAEADAVPMVDADKQTMANIDKHLKTPMQIMPDAGKKSWLQNMATGGSVGVNTGAINVAGELLKNPGVIPIVAMESFPAIGTSLAGGALGGIAGGAIGNAPGAAVGAAAGAGLASGTTEFASSLVGYLREKGQPVDEASLAALVRDPAMMADAKQYALLRGVPVAIFDALSAGMAGRIAGPVARSLGGKTGGKIAGGSAEVVAQGAGGAAGEASAQQLANGEINDPTSILFEALAEVPGSAIEVPASIAARKIGERFGNTNNTSDAVENPLPDQQPGSPVPQDGVGATGSPPDAPTPSMVHPVERAILRMTQMTDEDIDLMSPEERQAEVEAAMSSQRFNPTEEMVRDAMSYGGNPAPEATEPQPSGSPQEAARSMVSGYDPSKGQNERAIDIAGQARAEGDFRSPAQKLVDDFRNPTAPQPEPAPAPEAPREDPATAAQRLRSNYDPAQGQNERALDIAGTARAEVGGKSPAQRLIDGYRNGTRKAPATVQSPEDMTNATQHINTSPSDAQIAAGNYQKGHVKVSGIDVTIETPKGATRRGTSPDGTPWSVDLPAHYGYVKRTTGADGDQVDVYVGDNHDSKRVYVVDQIDATTRKFDEHKAIMGASTLSEAKALYEKGFSDGKGSQRVGAITPMSTTEFRKWLKNGKTNKPVRFGQSNTSTTPEGFPADAKGNIKKPESLIEFLAKRGGIRDEGGTLQSMGLTDRKTGFVAGGGPLVRKQGMSLDKARALAVEAGYLDDAGAENGTASQSYVSDLLDALDTDMRSSRQHFSRLDADHAERWMSSQTKNQQDEQYGDQETYDTQNSQWTPQSAMDEVVRLTGLDPNSPFAQDVAEEMANSGSDFDAAAIKIERQDEEALSADLQQVSPESFDEFPDLPFFGDDTNGNDAGNIPETGAPSGAEGQGPSGSGQKEPASTTGNPVQDPSQEQTGGSNRPGQNGDIKSPVESKPVGKPQEEVGADGKPQLVMPGMEQISSAELAQIQTNKPLKPKAPQKDPGGMFSDDVISPQFEDLPTAKPKTPAEMTPEEARAALIQTKFAHVGAVRLSDGRAYRVKKEGEGYIVLRMSEKPGIPNYHSRPEEKGVNWSAAEAADHAIELSKTPDKPKPAPKPKDPEVIRIGSNGGGNPLFEDDRGVRYYTEDGVRVYESIKFQPVEGGYNDYVNEDARGDDYLTQEERDEKAPKAPAPAPEKPASEAPKPAETPKPKPSGNTIFTDDAADKARALIKAKLSGSTLNSGIDPELALAGFTIAGYHIEKGARTFAAYAKAMVEDFGQDIKPYLKGWYLNVKFDPRGASFDGMSGAAEVEAFDVSTIGQEAPEEAPPKGFADQLQADLSELNNRPVSSTGEFPSWSDAKDGDLISKYETLVKKGIRIRREAQKLADEVGGKIWRDGADKFAVVTDSRIPVDVKPQAPVKAEPAPPVAPEPQEKPASADSLVNALRDHFLDESNSFKTIVQARKFLTDRGWRPVNEDIANKEAEEVIERAVVLAAREMVRTGKDPKATYDKLVNLYDRQPRLATRTSTSMADQAYSTPIPLAFVASQLADIKGGKSVFEPTAGNGALLIETNTKTQDVNANELNDTRFASLKDQGYKVTQGDATTTKTPQGTDRIIANPPFGAVRENGESKVFNIDGYRTTAIDQAIVMQSLDGLRGNGKAVFIIGGVKGETEEARADGYRSSSKRKFFKHLYDNFNVTQHFTVSGDLYVKQGAAWPVDVIVVDGRSKSALKLPAANVPVLVNSWTDLKGYLDGRVSDVSVQNSSQVSETVGEGTRPTVGDRPSSEAVKPSPAPRPAAKPKPSVEAASGTDAGGKLPVTGPRLVSDGERELESGGNSGGTDNVSPTQPREPRVKSSANDAGQVPYRPYSAKGTKLNTLVPAALGASMDASLARIEEKHGSIDKYVAKELGYTLDELPTVFSAEQIDAIALAIDNVAKGSGFIIGDQTGIGKGRIVAAVIRYAHRQGIQPVFVTEKPDLYGDMFRDLDDIQWEKSLGRKPEIFMTNVKTKVPLDDDAVEYLIEADEAKASGRKAPEERGKFTQKQTSASIDAKLIKIRSGAYKPDVIFTTYTQMQTVDSKETTRRDFMTDIAPRSFIIMDESHNAGGQGADANKRKTADAPIPASVMFRKWITAAKSVMYSSATFAKNPNVMDLYSRTDMMKAVEDPEDLAATITAGGVPLQQIISSTLARAGQYARRERSFEGVDYGMEVAPVDQKSYAGFANSVGKIFKFDRELEDFKEEWIKTYLDEAGAGMAMDNGVGDVSANSTAFSSVMHNIVSQMVLSIKADAAADRAIQALNEGEKPVIALSATNETFMSDFAEDNNINIGDPMDIGFKDMVVRYLERTLRITIKDPDGKGGETKRHIFIPVSDLSPELKSMFKEARKSIDDADLASLPLSPIDHIRNKIQKAGYSVSEVTGRKTLINYSGPVPVYENRPSEERGAAGKRVSIKKFNDGALDAVILNKSGSTGVSLHASSKFKNKSRRRMIIVQADANIDTHMQMLGRVHRTGQVIAPAYSQLMADIPAEARPTAILMRKMASLNANTTASRKSKFTADAVDFMNEYGDTAAVQWAKENPVTNLELGEPVRFSEKGKLETDNPIQKLTGRIMLLVPEEQQKLLDNLTDKYNAILAQKEALGENALEAKAMDLDARPISKTIIKDKTGPSPFEAEANMELMNVKSVGRALKPFEVVKTAAESIGMVPPEAQFEAALSRIESAAYGKAMQTIRQITTEHNDYVKWVVGGLKNPEAKENQTRKNAEQLETWSEIMRMATAGKHVSLDTGGETPRSVEAIIVGVVKSDKAQSPTAASNWSVRFALPDNSRILEMPFSQISTTTAPEGSGILLSSAPYGSSLSDMKPLFEAASKTGRQDRYIATGNILAAFDQLKGKGQIIQFTDENGDINPGVLMPNGFSVDTWSKERRIRFNTVSQIMKFLDQSEMKSTESSDGFIRIESTYNGYKFEFNAGRAKGGKYFTDSSITAIHNAWAKVGGGKMTGTVTEEKAKRLIPALQELGAKFVATSQPELASEIMNGKEYSINPFDEALRPNLSDEQIKDIEGIVSRVSGIETPVWHELISRPDGNSDWGVTTPTTAAGYYDPLSALIGLSLNSATNSTAYHEAFHHVQHVFLDAKTKKLLVAEKERLKQIISLDGRHNPDVMSQSEIEAEAFSVWANAMDENDAAGIRLHVGIRKVWQKIRNTLERVKNALNGMGYQTVEDVFGKARSGETAKGKRYNLGKTTDRAFSTNADGSQTGPFGKIFTKENGNPKAAIDRLMAEKGGEVPAAYTHPEIGDIAFVYGNSKFGLKHIVEGRGEAFLEKIPSILKKGKFVPDSEGLSRAYLVDSENPANAAVIRLDWDGVEKAWLVTSMIDERGKFEGNVQQPRTSDRRTENLSLEVPDKTERDNVTKAIDNFKADDSAEYALAPMVTNFVPPGTTPANAPAVLLGGRIKASLATRAVAKLKKLSPKERKGADDGESAPDYLHRKLVDYLHPLKMLQERERGSVPLHDLNDAYLNARLAEDAALAKIQNLHDTFVSPAVSDLAKSGASLEDLHDLLYAQHAEERNRVIGLKNRPGSDMFNAVTDTSIKGASGLSTDEANATVARLQADPVKFRALEAAADKIRMMLRQNLSDQRRAGLISTETYDLLTTQWQNYIPLKGNDGQDDNGNWNPSSGKGFDVRGKEFHAATGRFSDADNTVVHSVMQSEKSIIRQKKNEVGKAVYRFVNEFDPQGDKFAQIYWSGEDFNGDLTQVPSVYKREIGPDGKVRSKKVASPFTRMDDVVATKIGGKTYYIKFNDEKVGLAIRKMNVTQLSALTKAVRPFTTLQSFINTRANPVFIPINIIRDATAGGIHLMDEGVSKVDVAKTLASIPNAMSAVWRSSRGKAGNGDWDLAFKEMQAIGGKINFDARGMDFEHQLTKINKDLSDAAGNKSKLKKAREAFVKFIVDLNDAGEMGFRLATYRQMRKEGRTQKEAAFTARDLTVDFKKHGEMGPAINSWYVFFNAALQGNYNVVSRLYKSKTMRYVAASAILGGVMQSLWNEWASGIDDDGESYYDKLMRNEGYRLERQMVFFIPGTKNYVSFPLPYGYNAFWHFGTQGTAAFSGKQSMMTSLLNSGRVAFSAFNPIGAGSIYSMISPTISDPAVDLMTNTNFFGRNIYPAANPFDNSPAPNSTKSWGSTGQTFKDTAEWMNWISGGTTVEQGLVDVHPDTLEYLWNFYTGGIGRFLSQSYETGTRAIEGDFEPKKTPWVKSFYGNIDEQSQRSEYFKQRESVEDIAGKLKDYSEMGDGEHIATLQANYPAEVRSIAAYQSAEKARKKIAKQRRGILGSDMSSTEKKQLLESLDEVEIQIMKQARTAFAQARKAQ